MLFSTIWTFCHRTSNLYTRVICLFPPESEIHEIPIMIWKLLLLHHLFFRYESGRYLSEKIYKWFIDQISRRIYDQFPLDLNFIYYDPWTILLIDAEIHSKHTLLNKCVVKPRSVEVIASSMYALNNLMNNLKLIRFNVMKNQNVEWIK